MLILQIHIFIFYSGIGSKYIMDVNLWEAALDGNIDAASTAINDGANVDWKRPDRGGK